MRCILYLLLWAAVGILVSCEDDPTESLAGVHDLSTHNPSNYLHAAYYDDEYGVYRSYSVKYRTCVVMVDHLLCM